VRALDDVVRAGKVRYVGFCNLSAWQAMKALGLANVWNMSRFVEAHRSTTRFAGRDIDRELVPLHVRRARDLALESARGRAVVRQVRSGQAWACRCAPDSFDFPQWTDRACPKCSAHCAKYRGLRAARSRASHWRAAHAAVRHEHHHRREEREQLTDNLAAADLALSAEHVASSTPPSTLPVRVSRLDVELAESRATAGTR